MQFVLQNCSGFGVHIPAGYGQTLHSLNKTSTTFWNLDVIKNRYLGIFNTFYMIFILEVGEGSKTGQKRVKMVMYFMVEVAAVWIMGIPIYDYIKPENI